MTTVLTPVSTVLTPFKWITFPQIVEWPVKWDNLTLIWCHIMLQELIIKPQQIKMQQKHVFIFWGILGQPKKTQSQGRALHYPGNKNEHIISLLTMPIILHHMMMSSNGNIFCVTGHLCGEFTSPRWIPRTKASDAELWCFLWSASD